jgi:RNA polymerase sigma-70 factor (ECF subfamily)
LASSRARPEPVDFEALVRHGQQAVMRYLLARTGSPGEASELTQETFVRAYCALANGERPRHPIPWLLAIARNVFLEAMRSQRYQRQLRDRMARIMGLEWESPWHEQVERRLIVAHAIDGLSADLREPVLLHYFAGLSLSEVAGHLEITAGAVKTRLWRARQALRGELEVLVSDINKKAAVFAMPRDLAAKARLIAERPPIYDSLYVGLQVGGQRWPTAPTLEPEFSGEGLRLADLQFAIEQLHAARVAWDRALANRLELWPLPELLDHPQPVEVWSFLRSAELGNDAFQNTEEGHLVPTDGWRLGTDPQAPQLLADFRKAGLRHVWFTFAALEKTHDELCERPGAFAAIVNAMKRCRDAGIETGANIMVSTRNTGQVKDLALLIRSLGAERFIPTYAAGRVRQWPAYEDIRPEPEDLVGLPPQGLDVNWGYQEFWANLEAFTEGALTRAAVEAGRGTAACRLSEQKKRGLWIWVAPNLDMLMRSASSQETAPTPRLANLRDDSPAHVHETLRNIQWPPDPPSDAELARRYGDTESRKVYMSLGHLRRNWLEAWRAENNIPWLPFD